MDSLAAYYSSQLLPGTQAVKCISIFNCTRSIIISDRQTVLMEVVGAQMQRQGSGAWSNYAGEYLVRAVSKINHTQIKQLKIII